MRTTRLSRALVAVALAGSALLAPVGQASADEAAPAADAVPMYRLYNRLTHEHLYTADAYERDVLSHDDWVDEGVGWTAPATSSVPVHRLYNPILHDHHYTTDTNEVKVLTEAHGWRDEGIGWYSADSTGIAVYRQFNAQLGVGAHNYTADRNEYDVNNGAHGWAGEGVGWYAAGPGAPASPVHQLGYGSATYDSRTGQYSMPVAWSGQQTNVYCGPASLEMVLRYRGFARSVRGEGLSQQTLAGGYYTNADGLHLGRHGTSWEESRLSLAANRWMGTNVYVNHASPNAEQFRNAVVASFKKDAPVMVDTVQVAGSWSYNSHTSWGTASHILVVTGYNEQTDVATFLDPLPGAGAPQFAYNLGEFAQRFLQSGVLGGHGMVY